MTFPSAGGYNNLPNGNWSPEVFSQKVLRFFRTAAVAESITNTDYAGEISDSGDTVNIIKEPVITVQDYVRGKDLEVQDLIDEALTLVVDKGKAFMFGVDDIEKKMSHIGWSELAQSSGAYALTNHFDKDVLQYMFDNGTDVADLGGVGSPKTIGYGGGTEVTPLDLINLAAQALDENDVPQEGRWFLASPKFYTWLGKEDGKLIDVSVTGDPESLIRSRKIATTRMIHGFMMFKSNNNPLGESDEVTIMAGHRSATATATAITKSESCRREKGFGDLYKSLLVYGRKVLRPEALVRGRVTFA